MRLLTWLDQSLWRWLLAYVVLTIGVAVIAGWILDMAGVRLQP